LTAFVVKVDADGVTGSFAGVEAGHFVGRRVKVARQWTLALDGASGAVIGTATSRPSATPGRGRRYDGTLLTARDGGWFVPTPMAPPYGNFVVVDLAGVEVARVTRRSRDLREISLPGGVLVWHRHAMRPQYRVDDLFTASRAPLHSFVPGFARRMFTGELTPALAAAPDAALIMLLASWMTWREINARVAEAATDGSSG
jgi:hypothetical protein